MKGRKNRFYREGCAHHLYLKAQGGNLLFYRSEDYLFFLTLLYVLAKRYGIRIEALCIMFNHIHIFVKPVRKSVFDAFCRDLQSLFARGYNVEYRRSGPLMMLSGFAPKITQKSILSCLVYIVNNPVTGKIVRRAQDYKWNLLAYIENYHPFSERLVKRESSSRLRKALGIIDCFHMRGRCLNYAVLRLIFNCLTYEEKRQAMDYIILKYNPLDKNSLLSRFGDYGRAVIAFNASAGAEHDINEQWEDYSVYTKMLRTLLRSGLDHHGFRFGEMDKGDLLNLVQAFSDIPHVTEEHIRRFLHL